MELLKNLSLDHWWNILLLLGVACIGFALMTDIQLLNPKHLLGLGIGLFIIGFSHIIVFKHITIPANGGFFQTKSIIHKWYSKLMFAIGILISILFLTLIIIKLI